MAGKMYRSAMKTILARSCEAHRGSVSGCQTWRHEALANHQLKRQAEMYNPIQVTATVPSVTTSLSRSPLRLRFLLVTLALAWLALSPTAQAVDPPPDGGYPNGNTAEGDDALFSPTTGSDNSAMGFDALDSNTT